MLPIDTSPVFNWPDRTQVSSYFPLGRVYIKVFSIPIRGISVLDVLLILLLSSLCLFGDQVCTVSKQPLNFELMEDCNEPQCEVITSVNWSREKTSALGGKPSS